MFYRDKGSVLYTHRGRNTWLSGRGDYNSTHYTDSHPNGGNRTAQSDYSGVMCRIFFVAAFWVYVFTIYGWLTKRKNKGEVRGQEK